MSTASQFRDGDAVGVAYRCSGCNAHGPRLWRQSHTFLSHLRLLCAECAETDQQEAVARYAALRLPHECTIGDLVPARPTPEGDTFWGHTSGDTEWWYKLPQFRDPAREAALVRSERDHFLQRAERYAAEWLAAQKELDRIKATPATCRPK
jgi:hypothetical protein